MKRYSFESIRTNEQGPFEGMEDPDGKYVKWEDFLEFIDYFAEEGECWNIGKCVELGYPLVDWCPMCQANAYLGRIKVCECSCGELGKCNMCMTNKD